MLSHAPSTKFSFTSSQPNIQNQYSSLWPMSFANDFLTMACAVSTNLESNLYTKLTNFFIFSAILSLYLSNKLGYGEDTATTLYHAFSMCVYFFPLIGAIVSDSWLGKFKTIAYLSVVYMLGNITLSTGSLPYWALTIR